MQPTKAHTLEFNDIGAVRIAVARPIAADPYAANRATGSFILIDEATHRTAGAGMIDG
jgi:sulfate adenylyltransferase subunit 1 (EFTu-like GTPase family)